ncbi:MAG: RNA polymerase subunit sigma-24, partial [Clostridia bacterium]|nr:RNA polymerase subunit sigma-24 [Clostridia bacterium]
MQTAEQIWRTYLDGDDRALGKILELYHDSLILFINRYVHDLNTAEDLAADSFAQLFLKPKKYNFSVTLKTYL